MEPKLSPYELHLQAHRVSLTHTHIFMFYPHKHTQSLMFPHPRSDTIRLLGMLRRHRCGHPTQAHVFFLSNLCFTALLISLLKTLVPSALQSLRPSHAVRFGSRFASHSSVCERASVCARRCHCVCVYLYTCTVFGPTSVCVQLMCA